MFTPVTKFRPSASQPKAGDRVGEPESSGVEVEMHEPDDRQHDQRERHVGPTQRGGVGRRRLRPHHRQLEGAEDRRRDGEREKQQMGVLRLLLEPDEQMNDAERQTRRGHRDPDNLDPVHVIATIEAAVAASPNARVGVGLPVRRATDRSDLASAIMAVSPTARLRQRRPASPRVARTPMRARSSAHGRGRANVSGPARQTSR